MDEPELTQEKIPIDQMNEGLLSIGQKFIKSKLTPVFYLDKIDNIYYIINFEKANYGYH